MPRTRLGLFDQQFVQQTGNRVIDELAAVIAVKATNSKWKLCQHGLQHRHQPRFADMCGCPNHLPLCDLIDGVDVVHPFYSLQIALMNRVDTQISRSPLRLRHSPFANRHRCRPGRPIHNSTFAVPPALPQPIQMRHRDLRQPLIPLIPKVMEFPLQDLLRRRTAQCLVGFIHACQQFDIRLVVTAGKAMPTVRPWLHCFAPAVQLDQPCNLRSAQSRHLGQISAHQPTTGSSQPIPALLSQRSLHPAVDLFLILGFELNLIARFQKRPDLLQAYFLCRLHADNQLPACGSAPPGSSCVRNKPVAQAHLV